MYEKVITEQMVFNIHSKGVTAIKNVLSSGSDLSQKDLTMDISPIADVLGWKILVPFLTTVVGGLSVQIMRKRFLKSSSSKNKAQVMKSVGKEIVTISDERKEECILMIHDALKPLGVSREQARRVFDSLIKETQSNQK